ncbi:MAG: acetyl-CoA C-acyltransferase [Deltaproteobacteria bacterium]|nr:acetyl-CoA C-acyltransferase [Deltaproteobacteria bacterium]
MAAKKPLKRDRIALVGGKRTPFTKSWSTLGDVDPVQLSTQCVRETLFSLDVPLDAIDHIIWGTVVSVPRSPNVAREIALDLNLYDVPGVTVSRACATGFDAVAYASRLIMTGEADVVVAGGVDVVSAAPVPHKKDVIDTLQKAQKQKGFNLVKTIAGVNPKDLFPSAPSISERYTGKTMGEHAEDMVKYFDLPRAEQDAMALDSHRKAAAAREAGHVDDQIVTVLTKGGPVSKDNLIREEMDPDKVASLRPVFDRTNGTITAATSSPLTDGASCVVLMRASKAKELGFTPRAWVESWHFPAVDPRENMLLGNVTSVPFALQKAGITLEQCDVVEIHEAFAAQVLANLRCFEDEDYCKNTLGLDEALGAVDPDKLNMWGGSIAYGHPFAATGGRILINAMHLLEHVDGEYAITTACAAGGLGAAMVLRRGA